MTYWILRASTTSAIARIATANVTNPAIIERGLDHITYTPNLSDGEELCYNFLREPNL